MRQSPAITHTDKSRSLALAAASQAADATSELVAYVREGAQAAYGLFADEPIEKLLDAAKLVLELEGGADLAGLDSERLQVYTAISNYLEGWAG